MRSDGLAFGLIYQDGRSLGVNRDDDVDDAEHTYPPITRTHRASDLVVVTEFSRRRCRIRHQVVGGGDDGDGDRPNRSFWRVASACRDRMPVTRFCRLGWVFSAARTGCQTAGLIGTCGVWT
jgi:hypothetical protein